MKGKNMRSVRVKTTVENDACKEEREFTFRELPLFVHVQMNPDKESYVWASYFKSDATWTFSLGNVTMYNVGSKDMLKLLEQINTEIGKEENVTSDDSA